MAPFGIRCFDEVLTDLIDFGTGLVGVNHNARIVVGTVDLNVDDLIEIIQSVRASESV